MHPICSSMTAYSLLDLVPIVQGGNASQAFANAADLARHAEGLGYTRYWVAEHHGMEGIASAATAVVIGHVGAATRRIRIGAGGIMRRSRSPSSSEPWMRCSPGESISGWGVHRDRTRKWRRRSGAIWRPTRTPFRRT
jgi:hypothetical protein